MSGRISDAQLARMRAQGASTFDTTVVLSAPSNTKDGAGGISKSYTPVTGGTVLARIGAQNPTTDKYLISAGKTGLVFDYTVSLPYNAPINADYHVSFNGRDYAVVLLVNDQSLKTANRAYVARVSNG